MTSRCCQLLSPVFLCCVLHSSPVTAQVRGVAPEKGADPGLDQLTPVTLVEKARAAFESRDFATAEKGFETFIAKYGAMPEMAEAVRIHTPLLALSKVAVGRHEEALDWIGKSLSDPKLPPALEDELSFWRGICFLALEQWPEAQHALGRYWSEPRHREAKRVEALLLFAHIYLLQGFPGEAAALLGDQIPKIRARAPEGAGRALVLRFHALLVSDQEETALQLVKEEFPRLDSLVQVASFQSLTVALAGRFIEERRWHDAISCLQRVWPRDRILRVQEEKRRLVEERLSGLSAAPGNESLRQQLGSLEKRIVHEVEAIEKAANFDSAVRLRLATAYQGLDRPREAALILDDMLVRMPADEVVDTASLTALQCWMQVERWDRVVDLAALYEERFGSVGRHLPMVLFLKAESLRKSGRPAEAAVVCDHLLELFPEDDLAPRALFLQGILYLEQDDNDGALFHFEKLQRNHPGHELVEDGVFWSAMALAFDKQYAESREAMGRYLEVYGGESGTPKYGPSAIFRIAVCTFSLAEYTQAADLFRDFLARYAGDDAAAEARLLLGDALLGLGEIDEGLAVYRTIPPESGRFFEEAWFKTGKAFKLTERYEEMKQHFETFVKDHPDSPRLPEAVYWIGWNHLREEHPDAARSIYWETLRRHGDNAEMSGMEDLLSALPKVYRDGAEGGGRERLLEDLEKAAQQANQEKKATLALRCDWARSVLEGKADAEKGRRGLASLKGRVDPRQHNPMLSVDVAEALEGLNGFTEAGKLYAEIRRWHPNCLGKDRLHAGLARVAESQEDWDDALRYYGKCERETAQTSRLGDILLAKGRILSRVGRRTEAMEAYEKVLEIREILPSTKAEALLQMGDLLVSGGELLKATAYYERLYVSYGRYGELVAAAYEKRAAILEELDRKVEALEVWSELAEREDLADYPESGRAKARLAMLAPTLRPEESARQTTGGTGS